jgi:phosphoserine/homoserine phosphotransferase
MLFAIDLEGVLAPEIWPILGQRFGLPRLSLTTRETPDLEALMATRVQATRAAGLRLVDLQGAAMAIEPDPGARDFLSRLRTLGPVIVISDTFHELAEPLMQRLGGFSLFANRFEIDAEGRLSGVRLRVGGRKERIVSGFKDAGYKVGAMGDSLNDLTILTACDAPVLYRPIPTLIERLPDAPIAQTLDEAYQHFETAHRRLESS